MGLYSRYIFPRICDLALNRPFVARHRQELLKQAHGKVLEIGFGTGLNLPCYPEHVRKLTMVEPNTGMHRLAQKRIKHSGISIEVHKAAAEELPFDDGVFDCVVSTFTMCSIKNVTTALADVYRVLKPAGQFLFLEHGLSNEPRVQRWQHRLNWLQKCLADGCHLNRNIKQLLAGQPFDSIHSTIILPGEDAEDHWLSL